MLGLSALVAALVAAGFLSKRLRTAGCHGHSRSAARLCHAGGLHVHNLFDVTLLKSPATTLSALLAVLSAADAISPREARDG